MKNKKPSERIRNKVCDNRLFRPSNDMERLEHENDQRFYAVLEILDEMQEKIDKLSE